MSESSFTSCGGDDERGGESIEGIAGIATPIVDSHGTTIAAVHVSAPRDDSPATASPSSSDKCSE
ncbi:hypothetical protein HYG77_36605 (plasmid) [Rhodococcus sp. ZPP]|nr:hypothetical protein [Rhodococcus erythropolis]QTJ71023.1 hypothetical protein HYG77_36605 [Rhodococcus sp. ZPP]